MAPSFIVRAVPEDGGWRARCDCGWFSPVYGIKDWAEDAAAAHAKRTPAHEYINDVVDT